MLARWCGVGWGWSVVEMGNRRKTNNNITQRCLLKLFSFVQSFFLTPNRVDISCPVPCSLFSSVWLHMITHLNCIGSNLCACVCVCVCWPISLSLALHLALVWRLFTALGGNKLALGKLALLAILMFAHKKQRQIQLNLYWQASRLATLALANDDWAVQIKKFITKPDNKAATDTDRQKAA